MAQAIRARVRNAAARGPAAKEPRAVEEVLPGGQPLGGRMRRLLAGNAPFPRAEGKVGVSGNPPVERSVLAGRGQARERALRAAQSGRAGREQGPGGSLLVEQAALREDKEAGDGEAGSEHAAANSSRVLSKAPLSKRRAQAALNRSTSLA